MKPKFTFLLLFTALATFSQTTIIGNVSSEEKPLLGANVIIKGTEKGTITDFDGNFKLQIHQKDTLLVSYLGYDSKEIIIEGQNILRIVLNGNILLGEVKIFAYSKVTKNCVLRCCGKTICMAECYTLNESSEKAGISMGTFKMSKKLYPNPSKTGRFQLKLINDYKNVQIQVFNTSGLFVKIIASKPQNKTLHIDLSENASGIYLININADGKYLTTKKAIID